MEKVLSTVFGIRSVMDDGSLMVKEYPLSRDYKPDTDMYKLSIKTDNDYYSKHDELAVLSLSITSDTYMSPEDYRSLLRNSPNSTIGYIGHISDKLNYWMITVYAYFDSKKSINDYNKYIKYYSNKNCNITINQYKTNGDLLMIRKDDVANRHLLQTYIASSCVSSDVMDDYSQYNNYNDWCIVK